MVNTEPTRFSADKATAVAQEIIDVLQDRCEKICVAGSLRRRKPFVKDVEILFVPKFEMAIVNKPPTDLFAAPPVTQQVNMAETAIQCLLDAGLIAKRPNKNGVEAWGAKNKLGIHCHSGIPVDLFTATLDTFFNYLVCRTGGAENNVRICQAAISRGWKWNPYGIGFSRPDGELAPMLSEREVFDFVGLPYLEPWQR
jgi:DNA polymerase/3'-5' exonuclease PolX